MNILFYLRSICVGIGGVEVVTISLANYFCEKGHQVTIYALYKGNSNITERLHRNVKLYVGVGNFYCKENVTRLRRILIDKKINVAINQMGLPLIPILLLKSASKGLEVKIISVYHNAPSSNGRLMAIDRKLESVVNPIYKIVLNAERFFYKKITSKSMKYVYRQSDKYFLLSASYINEFKKFTGIHDPAKICVQPNPITVDIGDFKYNGKVKENILLYVGRLDYSQKRVDRVIKIWEQLEDRFPSWRLIIVGDGEERNKMQQLVIDLKLQHVSFEGLQDPIPYYKRASLLLLTSEYEGFPLVLPECMSFGVVPIVYGSYSAVYDIIENGKDGYVIPYNNSGFSAERMARLISTLIEDECLCCNMGIASIEKSKNYLIDTVYKQWLNKLKD